LPAIHPSFGKLFFLNIYISNIHPNSQTLSSCITRAHTVIPTKGGNHTPAFAQAAATLEAHQETITVTKALALVGFKVVADKLFFNQVIT